MQFEMTIRDMFVFSDGRTILVGPIVGCEALIKACFCEIVSDGGVRQRISIEGEQIVRKFSVNDLRAVATPEAVMLTQDEAQSGDWRLTGAVE